MAKKKYQIWYLTKNSWNWISTELYKMFGRDTVKAVTMAARSDLMDGAMKDKSSFYHRLCYEFNNLFRAKGIHIRLTYGGIYE